MAPFPRDFGPYRVLQAIGHGQNGGVFLAEDKATRRRVCLKLIHPALITQPKERERIRQAMLLTERIRHPGICRLEGLRREQNVHYIVMEHCEGTALRELLAAQGALPVEQVLAIARNICVALAAAHDVGVVHRDVKPGHVIVGPDGVSVKLIDFGMATALDMSPMTRAALSETRTFAAPELAGGEIVSPKSDQFALGVMLYAALTGYLPFPEDARSREDLLRRGAVVNPRSLRPDLPPLVDAIVMRTLAADPGRRFDDMRALEAVLARAADDIAMSAPTIVAPPHGPASSPAAFSASAAPLPVTVAAAPAPVAAAPANPNVEAIVGALLAEVPFAAPPKTDAHGAVILPSVDEVDDASWVVNGQAVGPPVKAKAMAVPEEASLAAVLEPEAVPVWEGPRSSAGRTIVVLALLAVGGAGVWAYFHFFR